MSGHSAFVTWRPNWVLGGRKVFFCPLNSFPYISTRDSSVLSYQHGHHVTKKQTGSSNLLFARAKIWSQVILIAAILVRPPLPPQLWICSLKIMNPIQTNKPITEIRAIHVLSILLQTEVSPQSSFTEMVVVNSLASKMKQKHYPVFFFFKISGQRSITSLATIQSIPSGHIRCTHPLQMRHWRSSVFLGEACWETIKIRWAG